METPDLIPFEDLPAPIQRSANKRTLLRMGSRGEFPKSVRMTPHSPPLWNRHAVEAWFQAKLEAAGA